MDLKELILTNGSITRDKGFNTSQHTLQLLLMVDEVVEAMEHLDGLEELSEPIRVVVDMVTEAMSKLRYLRKNTQVEDNTKVIVDEKDNFVEELADIFIRWASYSEQFGYSKMEDIIAKKMDKNKARPHKHGRTF